MIDVTKDVVRDYARWNGYAEVWNSWSNKMKSQGRTISPHLEHLASLPRQDVELDEQIAYDVIMDFITWFNGEHGG